MEGAQAAQPLASGAGAAGVADSSSSLPVQAAMSVEVKLSRMDRVYRPGDTIKGVIQLNGRGHSITHEGIHLHAEGIVSLQLSAKSVGLFEAFYSSIKPVQLLDHKMEIQAAAKLPDGVTEFPLAPIKGEKLQETYHGVFVNIQYTVTATVKRSMLSKDLKRTLEYIVEAPERERQIKPHPSAFSIVPESLENVKKSSLAPLVTRVPWRQMGLHHIPTFKITGQIDTVVCDIAMPLTGEVKVDECSATIKSIELQLVRVETCGYADGMAREATEIQNIQIADGGVCHGWTIPIHMVFPRLFTCPTASTRQFKVEFEVNLVILFSDGHLLTENFPLKLIRLQ